MTPRAVDVFHQIRRANSRTGAPTFESPGAGEAQGEVGGSRVTRTLPGLNADFAWDIVKDFFSIELLVATNRAVRR
jgi:hypothetical protein